MPVQGAGLWGKSTAFLVMGVMMLCSACVDGTAAETGEITGGKKGHEY